MRTFVKLFNSEGNSWIVKPKLEELPLMFWRFFENSYAVDTCQNFCENFKLVKVV